MNLDSTQLTTFATVVGEGSFEAAARLLNVTPSSVSQRIKALERAVGQVLIQRAKPCHATEAGQSLLRFVEQMSLLEREALHNARNLAAYPDGGEEDDGVVRVAVVVNADSLATWFLPALASMAEESRNGRVPLLAFDIRQDDQDHTVELLRNGSVMAAVTAERVVVQGCRIEPLGAMRYVAVSAPEFVVRHLDGTNDVVDPNGLAKALARAPVVAFDRKDTLQHRFVRSLGDGPAHMPTHYVPSVSAFNEAVRLGLGWAVVPETLARGYLDSGEYREVAPGRHLDIPLYWQHWRLDSKLLELLTETVKRAASAALVIG
ncbi:LysR family transcriptional regulator ArgP [Actinoplanes sp. L3-i22]|uniref:LysR family transcriptional regulator ArgP n=1 Tax=Actinoplanes sp. L3-i22 TaxID=2836373 RepID=UPI001C76DB18|nr:LysR family transcriptional regulator ArgP [Actinoplanes sp. L3-i22]BCY14189.1 putative transcriptional regulator, LysR family protein [Actinoplanes sp. L3-i22]